MRVDPAPLINSWLKKLNLIWRIRDNNSSSSIHSNTIRITKALSCTFCNEMPIFSREDQQTIPHVVYYQNIVIGVKSNGFGSKHLVTFCERKRDTSQGFPILAKNLKSTVFSETHHNLTFKLQINTENISVLKSSSKACSEFLLQEFGLCGANKEWKNKARRLPAFFARSPDRRRSRARARAHVIPVSLRPPSQTPQTVLQNSDLSGNESEYSFLS